MLFSEERLWFKRVAQDLTAILLLMHLHFIRNKWICRKKVSGKTYVQKSYEALCIPDISNYTQSSFCWNTALIFHFLLQ